MKFSLILLILLFQLTVSKFNHRITKISCSVSGKSVLTNVSCHFKTFKKNGYVSFRGTLVRRIPNAKVDYCNTRKNSDGYQKILEIKDIEICKILKDVESSSIIPFVKTFIQYVKSVSTGNLLNACNMTGEVYGYNVTMSNMSSYEFFPKGEYMSSVYFYDDLDDKIINVTILYQLIKF